MDGLHEVATRVMSTPNPAGTVTPRGGVGSWFERPAYVAATVLLSVLGLDAAVTFGLHQWPPGAPALRGGLDALALAAAMVPVVYFCVFRPLSAMRRCSTELERAFIASRDSLEAVVERNADGILIVDLDGMVRYMNPAGEALLGRGAEELVGEPFGVPLGGDGAMSGAGAGALLGSTMCDEWGTIVRTEIHVAPKGGGTALAELRAMATLWHDAPAWLITLRDITEERRMRKQALVAKLVESAQHDMMFVLDPRGGVVECNALAKKAFSARSCEILGRSIQTLFRPEPGADWPQILASVNKQEQWRGRVNAVCRGTEEFPAEMTLSRCQDEESGFAGTICLVRDISAEKEMERSKSDFIATASHELRTPMTSIKNAVDLVLRKKAGEINGQQERFLHMAERNIGRLSALVDDLLDLSKMEAGKMRLRYEEFDVRGRVEDVVAMFKLVAQAKSVNLDVHLAPDLPVVDADGHRVQEVLINLLDNAVKFTSPGGSVTVEAHPWRPHAGSAGHASEGVEVAVTDTGEGIAHDKIAHVFDKFFLVQESPAPDRKGTGLGLAICKAIVEAHGGVITCRSKPGSGSTFTFTLPARRRS